MRLLKENIQNQNISIINCKISKRGGSYEENIFIIFTFAYIV